MNEIFHLQLKVSTDAEKSKKDKKNLTGNDLRNKILKKYKAAHEQEYEKLKTKVKNVRDVDTIKNALSNRERSLSITSISSNDSILSDSNAGHKKKQKKKHNSSSSSSSSSSDSEDETDTKQKRSAGGSMAANQGIYPPGMYPNPETGEWMGMGMYPFPYFPPGMMPPMRPPFFQNHGMYRGNRFQRGVKFRGRGMRGRGRGGYYSNNYGDHKYIIRNFMSVFRVFLQKFFGFQIQAILE